MPDPDRPNLEKGTEPTVPISQPPPHQGPPAPHQGPPPPQQGWPTGPPGYTPPPPGPPMAQPWPGQPMQGGYGYPVPDHPRATMCLVLGILGVVLCQVVAPFAWVTGKRTVQEIDSAHGMLGGRSQAQAGYILGIVGTVLLGVGLLLMILYVVVVVAVVGGSLATSN